MFENLNNTIDAFLATDLGASIILLFMFMMIIFYVNIVLLNIVNIIIFVKYYKEPFWKSIVPGYATKVIFEKTFGNENGYISLMLLTPIVGTFFAFYLTYKQMETLERGLVETITIIFFPIISLFDFLLTKNKQYIGSLEHSFEFMKS